MPGTGRSCAQRFPTGVFHNPHTTRASHSPFYRLFVYDGAKLTSGQSCPRTASDGRLGFEKARGQEKTATIGAALCQRNAERRATYSYKRISPYSHTLARNTE